MFNCKFVKNIVTAGVVLSLVPCVSFADEVITTAASDVAATLPAADTAPASQPAKPKKAKKAKKAKKTQQSKPADQPLEDNPLPGDRDDD